MKTKDSFLLKVLRPFYKLYQRLIDEKVEQETPSAEKIIQWKRISLDREVCDIMTSRVDICAIEASTAIEDVVKIIAKSGFSRIPVYEKELDHIKGILHVKDLFQHFTNIQTLQWNTVLREPIFVPENMDVDDLLKEFQERKRHQAIIVDEFGSVVGIVSLEDILEEIVGEITDEFDSLQPSLATKVDDNTYFFVGKISINDFCKSIGLIDDKVFDQVKGDADTLAGLIIELAGHLPIKGETIVFEGYNFVVEKADKRKIDRVKLFIK